MKRLVDSIVVDFPEDRYVVPTMDQGKFFKVDYTDRCLYVPPEKALRANFALVDKFTDAVLAFSKADLTSPRDWSAVTLEEDNGVESAALAIISRLKSLITLEKDVSYVSCDIETKRVLLRDNAVLAIGFCAGNMHADIVTVFTPAVCAALHDLFALNRNSVHWIWHNGKFDSLRLKYFLNIDARVDEDTMLMHFVGINERRGTHRLKELGAIFCQAPHWEDQLDAIKKATCKRLGLRQDEFTYDQFPRHLLLKYLSYDVAVGRDLYFTLLPLMRENTEFIYEKLIQASAAYRDVELRGISLDMHYLECLELKLERSIEVASRILDKEVQVVWNPLRYQRESGAKSCPKRFNMKSPAQLKWLLQTVTGQDIPNTSKEVLEELFDDVGEDYPVINAIRELRKLNKYMDTYVQGLRDLVVEDGRIHGVFNLHGTETGRLSSSDPNMQNIPRDAAIKNLFVAADGFKLVQLDYSQAELRVLAYLSKDPFLTDVYQSGDDLHDRVATKLYGDAFTKEDRVKAKAVNFGIVYGLGPGSLSKKQKISFSEAKTIIDAWLANAAGAKDWIQKQRNMVHAGELPTTPFGRIRHFVVTYEALNHIQNEYVNFPVQSIASDLTVFSLLEMHQWIIDEGLQDDVFIVINVHDSIILEVRDNAELLARVAKKCKEIMCTVPERYLEDLNIPFKADVEMGYSWGNLEKYDEN